VATDDLNAPLGLEAKPARGRRSVIYSVTAGVLGAVIAVAVIWVVAAHDPLNGRPTAAKAGLEGAGIDHSARLRPSETDFAAPQLSPQVTGSLQGEDNAPRVQARAAEAPPEPTPAAENERIITIIDGSSGARREIRIPAPPPVAAVPAHAPAVDARLVQMTRDGPIPRIAADGTRVAQAFAQPAHAKPNAPQIAIVVTGLGTSGSGTEALAKLPAAVTFALASSGRDLERVAGEARSLGHELLLQVAMEPGDTADGAPPQPLLTTLSPEQNLDRLHWQMSRFQGYVGITNLRGDRLTASEAALTPILREIDGRGLIYVDDGSSPRSMAGQIAGSAASGFVRANLALDAIPTPTEIDRALAKLEGLARQNGKAVGFAAAGPMTIDRISRWAKSVEGRGIALVPISAASRGKAS
jgi:polysaccharide deacetylase 2 family uncharacterized protein YibQ